MIDVQKESDEVLYPAEEIVRLGDKELQHLKELALGNARKRVRLCAHTSPSDNLHEMFIVHIKDCYVRPHKHIDKVESMSILEGEVDVILFNDDGNVRQVIEMGDLRSGKLFYYRLSQPIYHTLLIKTSFLVFHEITEGPFLREKTVFPEWAPESHDESAKRFITNVQKLVS